VLVHDATHVAAPSVTRQVLPVPQRFDAGDQTRQPESEVTHSRMSSPSQRVAPLVHSLVQEGTQLPWLHNWPVGQDRVADQTRQPPGPASHSRKPPLVHSRLPLLEHWSVQVGTVAAQAPFEQFLPEGQSTGVDHARQPFAACVQVVTCPVGVQSPANSAGQLLVHAVDPFGSVLAAPQAARNTAMTDASARRKAPAIEGESMDCRLGISSRRRSDVLGG